MKIKKCMLILLVTTIAINSFSVMSFAVEEESIEAYEFFSLVQQFASDYMPGGIASGEVYEQPMNRLIVKTDSNEPLENYYGARAKLEGYDGIHILQYGTKSQANSAFANLLEDNIQYVEYDVWISLETASVKAAFVIIMFQRKVIAVV